MARVASRAARRPKQRFALGAGQHPAWRIETLRQPLVQLARRDQIGNDDGTPTRERTCLNPVEQVSGCGASRNHNETIARLERRPLTREIYGRVAKRSEVSHAYEPCDAGCGSISQCSKLNAEYPMLNECPSYVGIEQCVLSIVPCY